MRRMLCSVGMAMMTAVMAPALPPAVELVPVSVETGTLFGGPAVTRHFGYINLAGTMVIPPRFTGASWFGNGVARASVAAPSAPEGALSGLIDHTGRWVLSPRFSAIRFAMDEPERFWARNRETWFLIDRSGTVLFETECAEISAFSEGLAVVKCGDRTVVIDDRGIERFSPSDLGVTVTVPNSFRNGRLNFFPPEWRAGYNHMGFFDPDGNVAIAPTYSVARADVRFSEGYFAVLLRPEDAGGRDPGRFMTLDWEPAFGDRRWVDVRPFSEGLAAVAVRGSDRRLLWGFINRYGEMVIEPQFPDVERFSEGLAAVAVEIDPSPHAFRRGRWGAIDATGELVMNPIFARPFVIHSGAAMIMEPYDTGRVLSNGQRVESQRPIFINRYGDIIWDTLIHGRLQRE